MEKENKIKTISFSLLNFYKKFKDLFVVILIITSIFFGVQGFRKDLQIKEMYKKSQVDHTAFKKKIDSAGRVHAQTKIKEVYITQLPSNLQELIQQEARKLGVKPNDIKSHTQVVTEAKGDIKVPVINDSIDFSDGYLSLNAKIEKSSDKPLLFKGSYTYKDTAHISRYVEKKKVLGITYKKEPKIDFYMSNKNSDIVGMTNIDLKVPYSKPFLQRFDVQGYVGPGFGLINKNFDVNVGVGITFDFW